MELSEHAGKLFVDKFQTDKTEKDLKDHFSKYGEITECVVIVDKETRISRRFGFVTFADPLMAEKVLQERHFMDDIELDVKPATPDNRTENQEDQHAHRVGQVLYQPRRIFVGGLPSDLTKQGFKDYFEKFGTVKDAVILLGEGNRSRGFGFITFDSEEAVDNVMQQTYYELNDKLVEVQRAYKHVHTYDCNSVRLDRARSYQPQLGNQGGYVYSYAFFCVSCLTPYGYGEHKAGCLYYGQSRVGYVAMPCQVWQTYLCPNFFR